MVKMFTGGINSIPEHNILDVVLISNYGILMAFYHNAFHVANTCIR